MTDLAVEAPPCGSWRVLEYDHGHEAVVRWCDRTGGPCPYPGSARASLDHGSPPARECAAS